ncbi:MAG: glycosyltransferase [Bacteroidetes bacterium]|nr:glycosyltransferase [Bacteroidota bacterium]
MKSYKKGITAFISVYNEEVRIENCLSVFKWCNEIILIDKYSNDKTVEKAKLFNNVKIIQIENDDNTFSKEMSIFLSECTTEWFISITASDLIHKELADEIVKVVHSIEVNYDTISIPYRGYMMGQYNKYSPWYAEYANKILKTDSVRINYNKVHCVITSNAKSIYKIIINDKKIAFYHLTHENVESVINRYVRYWKSEAYTNTSLREDYFFIIKKFIQLLFIKKSFFQKSEVIALSFSFLSYYMLAYVYKWDKTNNKSNIIYNDIRLEIRKSWKLKAK